MGNTIGILLIIIGILASTAGLLAKPVWDDEFGIDITITYAGIVIIVVGIIIAGVSISM